MKQQEMIIQMHDIVKKAMKEDRKLHGDYDTCAQQQAYMTARALQQAFACFIRGPSKP